MSNVAAPLSDGAAIIMGIAERISIILMEENQSKISISFRRLFFYFT
jgi:hypothetical protein